MLTALSPDDAKRIASHRACPGVLLFSGAGKLLWTDRRAWELCQKAKEGQPVAQGKGLLPEEIGALLEDTIAMLRIDRKGTAHHTKTGVMLEEGRPLFMCAYGIPDGQKPDRARILIVLEEIGRHEDAAAEQAKVIFRFSNRETAVVRQLLKGWSNKQIAYELSLTEQTVKEHVARIMKKTSSDSRSGLLVRVLCL